MTYILSILASFIAVVVVLTLHEFSHAFIAYKCGDPTAKFAGRMTANPLKHFDPMGLCLFVIAGFGWAKPVPINPNNFKNRVWGSFWTSAAGILANYLSAFLLFYPLAHLTNVYIIPLFAGKYMAYFLSVLTSSLFWHSIHFAVFNFLPIYPLDGFNMWDALDRKGSPILRFLRVYGSYILLGMIVISILADYIFILRYVDLLGFIMNFVGSIVAWPIIQLWTLIFGI